MKQFDLMNGVNMRGTFLTTKLCLPHLRKGNNPHVLNLSPDELMPLKGYHKIETLVYDEPASPLFVEEGLRDEQAREGREGRRRHEEAQERC